MIQDFFDALVGHRQAVVTTTRGRTFLKEVEHFIARLHALRRAGEAYPAPPAFAHPRQKRYSSRRSPVLPV